MSWRALLSRGSRAAEPFFLDGEALARRAERERAAYLAADPFPHAVFDDLLPDAVVRRLIAEFPPPQSFERQQIEGEPQRRGKLQSRGEQSFSPFTRQVLHHFNAGPFLAFLERLTGIDALLPDPDVGHALRHFEPGGVLGVHADFNVHPRFGLDRRVNLLLYLTPEWRSEWGSELELWDAAGSRCVRRIEPRCGRAVVFTVADRHLHGFPRPLACPPGVTRRTVNLYYYTNGRPEDERSPAHPTLWHDGRS